MSGAVAEIDFGGMIQLLGFAQHLDDPYKNDDRAYLLMNRARLRLSGRYERISFYTEMGLGGEDAVVATTGVSLSLLDFAFNIPLGDGKTTHLKVGQFKVPYGREQLTYEGNFQFADRSINNLGFVVGRDVGAAVVSHPGLLTLIGGVFTGGGRDVPPDHSLSEKLGIGEPPSRADTVYGERSERDTVTVRRTSVPAVDTSVWTGPETERNRAE
jgi:hypothetical protein